jgi:hypothetical protein
MQQGQDQESIKSQLLADYKTDADTIDKDLYDFLRQLRSFKLVEDDAQA